jgi:hypothetical protein
MRWPDKGVREHFHLHHVVGFPAGSDLRCDSYMSGEILLGDADIHCTPGLVFHRRDKKLLVESAHRVM